GHRLTTSVCGWPSLGSPPCGQEISDYQNGKPAQHYCIPHGKAARLGERPPKPFEPHAANGRRGTLLLARDKIDPRANADRLNIKPCCIIPRPNFLFRYT